MVIGRMGRESKEIKMTPVCLLQQTYSVCNGAIHCQGGRNGEKEVQVGICGVKLPVRNPSKDVEQAKDKWLWSSEERSMLDTTMVP